MKWFWQRRKKETSVVEQAPKLERARTATAPLGSRATPLPVTAEPRSELLAFARDLLSVQGLRVRVEEDDLVTATSADGSIARYTASVARARGEEETTLLTQGAPTLTALFDDAAQRARVSAVTLARLADIEGLTLRALQEPGGACGRCANGTAQDGPAHTPTCEACPLRQGELALHWESQPQSPRVTDWTQAASIELTYRVSGRDRRGRREEWIRLAFDAQSGARLTPLTLAQLGSATAGGAARGEVDVKNASVSASEALQPGMAALSAFLAQRVGAEYQQRVADITVTHERLKREQPDSIAMVNATLERELASLADVYSVDVEAALDAICFIRSPLARLVVPTVDGGQLAVNVDAGRGVVAEPVCVACGKTQAAGRVCAQGHFTCAECTEACVHCDALRCPVCAPKEFARCGLCRGWTCANCARPCDECGVAHCPDHVWTCVAGDHTLCLTHLALCDECHAPLCQAHTAACAECGKALCPDHLRGCVTGAEALCGEHMATCATCHQPLCAAHTLRCDECSQAVCANDRFTCLGCGRGLCACSAPTPCDVCDVRYCARCHTGGGTCPACRSLALVSDEELEPLRLAAARDTTINLKRSWLGGRNALARVYVARGG
jgi:hypothetical protein